MVTLNEWAVVSGFPSQRHLVLHSFTSGVYELACGRRVQSQYIAPNSRTRNTCRRCVKAEVSA